jgi:hypothetical protein
MSKGQRAGILLVACCLGCGTSSFSGAQGVNGADAAYLQVQLRPKFIMEYHFCWGSLVAFMSS